MNEISAAQAVQLHNDGQSAGVVASRWSEATTLSPAREAEVLRDQGILGINRDSDELSGLVAAVAVACVLVVIVKATVATALWLTQVLGRLSRHHPPPYPGDAAATPQLRGGGV